MEIKEQRVDFGPRAHYYAVRFLSGEINEQQLKWWMAYEGLPSAEVNAAIESFNKQVNWFFVKLAVWAVGLIVITYCIFRNLL